MSYVRRNSGSESNSRSSKSDVNGNSGKFRKSASVEPGPSSLSDYGDSRKGANSAKKKSLTTFWHNLFRSNKITEKDESQSSDDRQSSKSSSSYESVNTILSTNSFSFVNPKKYKGKPVKGKRIPVDDTTLPRKQQETSSTSYVGNPSRRKISTFSRLGMKIGLKSKYNLQSCESLQHLNQLEDRNAGNTYVTTWNSNSSTFTRTNKRRAPVPPASSRAPQNAKPPESDPTPSAPPQTPIPSPGTPIPATDIVIASPEPQIPPPVPQNPPTEPQTPSSSNIQVKLQGRRRNSIGTDTETVTPVSGPSYSTKVVTSSNRYSIGQFLNNGNGKPFVITAGRHRRAASEGLNTNTIGSNTGTKGRIHVKGKKRAPPPPNPFGDPDAPEEPISPGPTPIISSRPSRSNRNSINLPENFTVVTSESTSIASQPQIASTSSASSQQNQSQVKNVNNKSTPLGQTSSDPNRLEGIRDNNPEVTGTRANVAAVPEVTVVIVSERSESEDANDLEYEIVQNILNDRQEQERELQQQQQIQQSASVSSSSTANSNSQSSASSANPTRHSVSISTHIHHPPVTERDVQVAKNELEALIKDNRSGSLESQAKKVEEQVKAQLQQLKREADKSPLLFFAQKQKQPTTTQANSSSIFLSPPNSPSPLQPSSPQATTSNSASSNANAPTSSNSNARPISPSQSPPPPLPAKITPRPWYKRSYSSSKNKNKNMKPISILPNFSEFDREATRIVEENRRKSAEQAYNETARELITMFNEFNKEQIHSETEAPTSAPEIPPVKPIPPTPTTTISPLPTNSISNPPSTINNSIVAPLPTPTVKTSVASQKVPTITSVPLTVTVASSANGLPSSSKDMKPLPTGNMSSSGTAEEAKKLAIVQPQSKSTPAQNISKPPIPAPTTSDSNVKLITTSQQSKSVVQTTSPSVVPMASASVSIKPIVTTTSPATPVSSINSSNSVTNPRSIFSYQSSSVFSNVPKTTISTSLITTSYVSTAPGSEWSCPKCTLRNAHWRNLCDACYFRRDSHIQSTSAIFDRINAQIKASSPAPAIAKQKSTFESPVATTSTTMATGTVSTAVEKPTQWVKPKTSDAPPGENFLSQLPNKENLTKEGKLEGMKLHDDPEVEELDITKVRQARLAFFARTKLEQEQQQYQQVNESKPNNLALASVGGDKFCSQGKERNVFSDGEDDSLDEILQLNANNCNNGPRTWKPLHVNRFRPMLESILESEGGLNCNLNKIYENWHLSDSNEYNFGQWTNTFMPVQEYANFNYTVDQLNSNNFLSNSSSEEFDEQDSTMERDGKSKNRHRTSRSSHAYNQSFHLTNDNFLPVGASANKEKKLTLEDYRKLGAIPKNYRDHNEMQQNYPTNSIERNDFNSHGRIMKPGENSHPPYGQSSSANFSDHTFAVSKLLRKLENAIASGDHRLAATLAHDLALLRVNCVVNKSSEPFTIRVYVEDRFMQQGPFLVQVTISMSVRELKMKIQTDWGIPSEFQKWILGRKVAENDQEILSNYELVPDSMAFLYLVTPDLDKSVGNSSLVKRGTDSSKKSKLSSKDKESSLSDGSPKSLPRSKKKIPVDMSMQTSNNVSEFSSKSLGRQNKGSKAPKAKVLVSASACQTEALPPIQTPQTNKEKESEITTKPLEPTVPDSKEQEAEVINKTATVLVEHRPSPISSGITLVEKQPSPITITKSLVPSLKTSKGEKTSETQIISAATIETKSDIDITNKPPTPPRSKSGHNKDNKEKSQLNSPRMEQTKIDSKTAPSPLANTAENLQSLHKSLPPAPAQTKKSDNNNILSPAQSPTSQYHTQPTFKNDTKETPPKLPPKNVEKKHLGIENKILNASPSNVAKVKTGILEEKKPIQEIGKQGKLELYPKYPITTTADISRAVVSVSPSKQTNNESKPQTAAKGDITETKCPTPTPRLSKSEGSKMIINSIGGLFAKLTSSPVNTIVSPVKPDVVAKKEFENEKKDATESPMISEPTEENKILLPPWRTSLIIEEVENSFEGPTPQLTQSTSTGTNESEKPSKSEIREEKSSLEVTITEEIKEKPIPAPRQRLDNSLKSPSSSNTTSTSVTSATKVVTNFTATPLSPQKLKPEVPMSPPTTPLPTTSLSTTPLPTTSLPTTPLPITPLPTVTHIAMNVTPQQNYQLKTPSSFMSARKTDASIPKELPSATNILVNKPTTVLDSNIAPSLPPKEPIVTNGHSEVEPNWNPEPIPKRRIKLMKKTAEKTEEVVTIEIKPINTVTVGNSTAKEFQLNHNNKTEGQEVNAASKIEPIYQNPKVIASTVLASSPSHIANINSVDGICQTTLPFPAKSPKSPTPQLRPMSPVGGSHLKTVTTNSASISPVNPVLEEKITNSVQVPTPEIAKKNLNSSIINMENGQLDDVKPSGVEKDVTFKKEEVQGAAAAVVDDKKEGNIETYLKMLQLMEKADLINTTEVAECPVCFNTIPIGEGIVLRDCLHIFCKDCLIGAVQYADDSEVKCPFRDDSYSCNSALQEREIKALVPSEIFEKYLARSVKLAESKMVNTFHCKTNDCTGWCIFEDDVNIFKCPVCQKKNCLTCQAIHEGIDCQQYQRELAIAAETDENAKSSRLMLEQMIQRGEALECPACHVVLLKKWGCDWVRCTYCKTEICWVTRNFRWGKAGKGDTSGGCKCGVNGIRCHPKCTYCH